MASAKVIQMKAKSKPAQLLCSGCGVSQNAACDCGVAYVPAAKAAAKAIARSPQKSDRAIAADLGIGKDTVRRARELAQDAPVARIGRDGKVRTMPRKQEPTALSIAEQALAQQRYEANLIFREVNRNVDEAVTRILAFGQKYPNMEEGARRMFTNLLMTSGSKMIDAERTLNGTAFDDEE